MYTLCTIVCYQDQIDDLLNQHAEILPDKFVFVLYSLSGLRLGEKKVVRTDGTKDCR
jgi:hypothetical protein